MNCEHNKAHDKLSFATLKHLAGVLDSALQQAGIKSRAKRESICGSFAFQSAYFLDNQWVEFGGRRYRVGLCFQEFAKDAFRPTKALVTDYRDGEMLHEAALGISEAHFTKESVVPSFQQVAEAYEKVTLFAHTKSRVWGTRNHWSLAPQRGLRGEGRECEIDLEIQGDEQNGYNLVMSPAGFFTADEWYETKEKALAAASQRFGIARERWSSKQKRRRA